MITKAYKGISPSCDYESHSFLLIYAYETKFFFFAGVCIIMAAPVAVFAQSIDQQDLIRKLTADVAALQAQIDGLRQTSAPRSGGAMPSSAALPTTFPRPAAGADSAISAGALPKNPAIPSQTSGESRDEGPEASASFDRDLYFGLRNDPDVSNLQEFLTDQGAYDSTISGNFFILTRNAVKKFQQARGLKPTGYFGSLSRAVANKILAGEEGAKTKRVPPVLSARGSFSLDPASAIIAVGETVKARAMFYPPHPACADQTPPCMMPAQAPYEVDVALISSDPSIARTTCPPEAARLTCVGSNGVYGVSPGTATMSATYANGADSFTATMTVRVISVPGGSGSLYIDPSDARLKVGETVAVQALFRAPCPASAAPCMLSFQKVDASFASDMPLIATVDQPIAKDVCAPPRACPVAQTGATLIRGVSPGDAIITASYIDNQVSYSAKIRVAVVAPSPVISDCAKEPADSQNSCWQTMAQQKGDISFCRNIIANVLFSQDSCISAAAQTKKDSALCAAIADASVKQGCVSAVASGGFFPFPMQHASSTP